MFRLWYGQHFFKGIIVDSNIREKIAELCHIQWSNWMDYIFKQCKKNDDGTMTIPVEAIRRWKSQALTSYKYLPTKDKDSDRKEADKFLILFKNETNERIIDINPNSH